MKELLHEQVISLCKHSAETEFKGNLGMSA